jgi:hypothetical protein
MEPAWFRKYESPEERIERKKREEAFWNRSDEQIRRDLVVPEEDLPAICRGNTRRWFRSDNVVDLARVRQIKGAKL